MRQAGYECEVQEVADGAAALSRLCSQHFDLVLLDWHMPRMTGIEVLERILEHNSALICGMVTAVGASMRARALEAGARFFLSKPLSERDLRAALDPLFDRRHNSLSLDAAGDT